MDALTITRDSPLAADLALLFERHKFSQHTRRQFDRSHPDISGPRGGYGAAGAHQHARMERAAALGRAAALKSASWGAFQIMGFNYSYAGYLDFEAFVADHPEINIEKYQKSTVCRPFKIY